MPLYGLQNIWHQKHPQPLNHLLIQFSLRYMLTGSIFFPSVTFHYSHFRHTGNCWKEQTGRSTVQWSNTEKCFPRKTDQILSLGVSEPCTPPIKQELHSWTKKCTSAYTVDRNAVIHARTLCHTAAPQNNSSLGTLSLKKGSKKLFHSFISKWHMQGQFRNTSLELTHL